MKDQAERLRELMKEKAHSDNQQLLHKKAKILAVTSGKGGVGKTNFAINLAISIRRLGYNVLIFDADIGLANVEILTRTNIKYTIADLLMDDKSIQEIIEEGPEGIKIISGGSGFNKLSLMNNENINRLLKAIEELESTMDYIIIDTGAGVSNIVLDFVMASDEVVLIITPDPTSIMDGYTVIKALTNNGYKGKLNIVINIVNSRVEATNIFDKLNKVSNNFLKKELKFLGYLESSTIVNKSVRNQQPFLLSNPNSSISKKINIIALKVMDSYNYEDLQEKTSFTERLKNLIFGRGGK